MPFGDSTASPFGPGTLAVATDPPYGPADLSRWVSPGTGSAELDTETGHLATMPTVRQRMLLILRTRRGSVVGMPDFGVELPTIIDEQFPRRVEMSIRASAVQLTDIERLVKIDSITVQTTALGRAQVSVSYTDLTSSESARVSATI